MTAQSDGRGGVWLTAYVALALLPMAAAGVARADSEPLRFASELAVTTGFVAFALLMLELPPISRLRHLSDRFGIDRLMRFHRAMGVVALVFVAAHIWLAGGRWTRSGAIAFGSTLLLVATSIGRRTLHLPYEAWHLLHVLLSLTLVPALLVHLFTARGTPPPRALALVIGAYGVAFVLLMVRDRIARPLWLARRPWEVVANRAEGGDTQTLVVRPLGHRGFDFGPGQFAWVLTGRHPLLAEQHPITFSSSAERPPDGSIELAIKALGDWSGTIVPALRPGARLWLDGPYGSLTTDRIAAQGFVLIAGGIGITPMLSILRTMRDRGDRRRVVLFHAARNRQRMVFAAELAALRRTLDLRIVELFEEAQAGAEEGFIRAELLRRHLPPDVRHDAFLACGPAPMLDAVGRALADVGVSPHQLHTERFDLMS